MTTDRVLKLLRRLIAQTDLMSSDLTDEELLEYIQDAQENLGIRNIENMSSFTIGTVQSQTGYGISPEPTTLQGHMMAYKAASLILMEAYQGKLYSGGLGVNWKSGLEEESTISAEKAWKNAIVDMENELAVLIIHGFADDTGERVQ